MIDLNISDLKQYLKKLRKNLIVLEERKAKYADSAPLALLNQLDDYKKAIELTKDTLIGDLALEDLKQALKPLILELDGPTEPDPLEISPPPEPLSPPEIRGFVGREQELNYFMTKLKETNLAVITGMVGCGKTALAATLAETWQVKQLMSTTETAAAISSPATLAQIKRKTFWYAFYPDEGILSLVYALAGFLYYDNQPTLWEMLESARITNASPPPPENLFNYVFQLIRNKGYLLCLDDVQFVHDDKLLKLFVDRLRELLDKNELHLILTAWEKPVYITQPYQAIQGLNQADTTHLLKNRGLTLSNELNVEVYTLTEGNAKLLDLTMLVLQKTKNPSRTLKTLAQRDDIERYLLKQVDNTLSDPQRDTLIASAVLLGHPAKRATLEEVSGHSRLKQTILTLSDRYLLNVHQDEEEGEELYQSHTIIRNFYYDFLNHRERKKLHTLAAEIYQADEAFIQAARHYERAEHFETAVTLLTEHFRSLMNQGQAQALQRLLKRLLKQNITPIQTIKATLALAEIYRIAAELTTAKEYYQHCLDLLKPLAPSIDKQRLIAKACQGMAEIVHLNDVAEALQWVEQGLTALETSGQEERINLLSLKGALHKYQSNYETAQQAIEEALQQIPTHRNWLSIRALKELGGIHRHLGYIEQAIQYATQALTLAEQYHDHFEMAHILNNLALCRSQKQDMITALSIYQQALVLAQDLGWIQMQLMIEENLGNLHINLGNYQEAEQCLLKTLTSAQEMNMKNNIIEAKINLTCLCIRQEKFNEASDYLKDALIVTSKVGYNFFIPDIYFYLTLVDLAKNNIDTALQHANQAVGVSHKLKLPVREGRGWRVLGQAHLANEDPTVALEAFAKSVTLLADRDFYELTQTQLEWGRYLITTPQIEEGKQLLQTAHANFKKMGAKVDLAETEALLKTVNS